LSTSVDGKHGAMRHFITLVERGSAAERAGLMTGDQVLMINGMSVYSLDHPQMVAMLAKAGAGGKTVNLTVASEDNEASTSTSKVAVFSPGQRVSAMYIPEEKHYDAVVVSVNANKKSAVVEYIGCATTVPLTYSHAPVK
jgi:C-terminal processing protease CtpA/Prc